MCFWPTAKSSCADYVLSIYQLTVLWVYLCSLLVKAKQLHSFCETPFIFLVLLCCDHSGKLPTCSTWSSVGMLVGGYMWEALLPTVKPWYDQLVSDFQFVYREKGSEETFKRIKNELSKEHRTARAVLKLKKYYTIKEIHGAFKTRGGGGEFCSTKTKNNQQGLFGRSSMKCHPLLRKTTWKTGLQFRSSSARVDLECPSRHFVVVPATD